VAHGVERAKQEDHRLYRQKFLDDLLADIYRDNRLGRVS
jgi:hypothetical protein